MKAQAENPVKLEEGETGPSFQVSLDREIHNGLPNTKSISLILEFSDLQISEACGQYFAIV